MPTYNELVKIMQEAADIIAGTKEVRLPIVDELTGFAAMLIEKQTKSYVSLRDIPADVLVCRVVESLIMCKGNVNEWDNTITALVRGLVGPIPEDVQLLDELIKLTGNWQDGSDTMVNLSQDDATRSCVLLVGRQHFYAPTFKQCIMLAIKGVKS